MELNIFDKEVIEELKELNNPHWTINSWKIKEVSVFEDWDAESIIVGYTIEQDGEVIAICETKEDAKNMIEEVRKMFA
jgi:hypothetical protein